MSEKVPVKIQCAIDGGQVRDIFLIFSNDNGNNWYEVEMTQGPQGYEVVIPNVNIGTRILYCFKAISNDGQEIIEDNRGQYYTQTALATTGTERQEVKKRKDLEIPSAAKEIEKKDKKNIEIKQNLKAS